MVNFMTYNRCLIVVSLYDLKSGYCLEVNVLIIV